MGKRIDRRVARTRHQLQAALIALMQQRSFETISVEEICAAADVGRSTFYTHYTGKDDLLRKGLRDFEAELADTHAHATAEHEAFAFVQPMLAHAQGHADHYRAHLAPAGGSAVALEAIHDIVLRLVRREVRSTVGAAPEDRLAREMAEAFMTGGFVAILTWWLARGGKPGPERLSPLARWLLAGSLAAIREGSDPAASTSA